MKLFEQFYMKCLVKAAIRRKDLLPVAGIHGMMVSSHVLLFLNRYNRKASHFLGGKRVRFQLYRNNGRLYSAWMSVPNGLEYVKTSIDRLQAGVSKADIHCTAVQAELERNRKLYRIDQAEHMEQLCINQMLDANRKNALEVMQLYRQIHQIASRQIEVLTETEQLMNRVRETVLDQIECYYIALCAVAPGKSVIPSPGDLQAISPMRDFPKEYIVARDNAKQICADCMQQIKELKDQITP